MLKDGESRAGIVFGIVAAVMVIALTVMALVALEPRDMQSAHYDVSVPYSPDVDVTPAGFSH